MNYLKKLQNKFQSVHRKQKIGRLKILMVEYYLFF